MKTKNRSAWVCGVALTIFVAGPAWADLLLLENELMVLRVIVKHPSSLNAKDRPLLDAISPPGRAFLGREVAAVAVTVTNDGHWFYRVAGHATTAPLEISPLRPTDAVTLQQVLATPAAAEMLYAGRSPATGSFAVQAKGFSDKLGHIQGAKAAGRIDTETEKMLLTWVGSQIRSRPDAVHRELARSPSASMVLRATTLADADSTRRVDLQKLKFLSTLHSDVRPQDIPTPTDANRPEPIWSSNSPGSVSAWVLRGDIGAYVFKCESDDPTSCVNPDGSIRRDKVQRAVFEPSIMTNNWKFEDPDLPCGTEEKPKPCSG